jgi:flagellar hook assembly protein FlgD
VPEGVTTDDEPSAVRMNHLSVAMPNPFNPSTTIRYSVKEGGRAEIKVYDVSGRMIRTLLSGFVPEGDHEVVWNGRDDSGRPVASGVYFYRFRTSGFTETRKMVLLK